MLMINIKNLNSIGDKYYFQGSLFTGIGFEIFGDKIENVSQFENGVNVDININKYFPNDKNIPHIDIDYIDFTGEYLDSYAFYKNHKFSGIAYELEGDQEFCLGQHLIKDGVTVVSIRWYPSGEKESLRLDREGIVQVFEWFKDGSIKKISLYSREYGEILVNITLSQAKQLSSVWIEGNYFQWIVNYRSKIEYHYFENINSFKDYSADPNLSLINSGLNDAVFDSIVSNDGLKSLCKIIIFNTSLTETAILELATINTLKQIILSDGKRNLKMIAEELKRKRPDLSIKLNEKEIIIN